MNQWWSWILAAIGITGLYLAGRHSLWGWAIGFSVQFLWIAYAVITKQWGFIFSALGYAAVNARNYVRWYKDERLLRATSLQTARRSEEAKRT